MWIENLEIVEKGNYSENRLTFYTDEIKEIVQQTMKWIDINSCVCSYYPIRSQVEMAMNWDIWTKFLWIKYWSETSIEKLAKYFVQNEIQ